MFSSNGHPVTVYLYTVKWDKAKLNPIVSIVGEQFQLGKLDRPIKQEGGALTPYTEYIYGRKYMFYDEDNNGNLIIRSFAVDVKEISFGFRAIFDFCKAHKKEPKFITEEQVRENPGFPASEKEEIDRDLSSRQSAIKDVLNEIDESVEKHTVESERTHYIETLEKFKHSDEDVKSGSYEDTIAEMAADEIISEKLSKIILDALKTYYEPGERSLFVSFSDLHGSVLTYLTGLNILNQARTTGQAPDLIALCIGDAVDRKARFYTWESLGDWSKGYYSDIPSLYISSHIYIQPPDSGFIYLHGNHDYNISYPTMFIYRTYKYQIYLIHGIIDPNEMDQIIDYDEMVDDAYKYSLKSYDIPENAQLFYFKEDAKIHELDCYKFGMSSKGPDEERTSLDLCSDPHDNALIRLKRNNTQRTYLTNDFFVPGNEMYFGYDHQIYDLGIIQKSLSDMTLKCKDIDDLYYNPVITFGHDYSYEVLSYKAYENKFIPTLLLPLKEPVWEQQFNYQTMKAARETENQIISRTFTVDGNAYITPDDKPRIETLNRYRLLTYFPQELEKFHESYYDHRKPKLEGGMREKFLTIILSILLIAIIVIVIILITKPSDIIDRINQINGLT